MGCNIMVGDLFTYKMKSEQSGGSPNCPLCTDMKSESVCHILAFCGAYSDIRERILDEYSLLCLQSKSHVDCTELLCDSETISLY